MPKAAFMKYMLFGPVTLLALISLHFMLSQDMTKQQQPKERNPKVWISSSVCWSSNTKFHKKGNFPYRLAAKLSTRLWHLKTNHSTVVHVVYEAKDEGNGDLEEYVADLRSVATEVVAEPAPATASEDTMDCSMKAQMQRMFAFTLPFVSDHDIVVTTDVDAFVLDPHIFADLEKDFYKIWVFSYSHTIKYGWEYNLSFIAMRSELWRNLLGKESPEQLLREYRHAIPIETKSWSYDQIILTRAILMSGLCLLPSNNNAWKLAGLNSSSIWSSISISSLLSSDSDTCFHGGDEFTNCNKAQIPSGKCKWWHFHADDNEKSLNKIFNKIANLKP